MPLETGHKGGFHKCQGCCSVRAQVQAALQYLENDWTDGAVKFDMALESGQRGDFHKVVTVSLSARRSQTMLLYLENGQTDSTEVWQAIEDRLERCPPQVSRGPVDRRARGVYLPLPLP